MNAFTSCQNTGAEPRPLVLATLLWFLYARSIFIEMALGRVILKRTAQGKNWLPRSSAICVGLGSGLSVSVKVVGTGLTEMSSRQEIPKIIFWYFLVVRHFTLSTPIVSFHVTLYFLTATKSPETLTNRLIVRYVMAWTLFCIMKHAHVFVFTSRRWGLSQLCGVWYEHDECCKARFFLFLCVCVFACAWCVCVCEICMLVSSKIFLLFEDLLQNHGNENFVFQFSFSAWSVTQSGRWIVSSCCESIYSYLTDL